MSELEWKAVLCIECEDMELIPKNWKQNWTICFDCGLFREAERLSNAE
jgi:hypothetical protein